jgi:hypothetical protein
MIYFDILDTITFVNEAWKIVKPSTIEQCWKKQVFYLIMKNMTSKEATLMKKTIWIGIKKLIKLLQNCKI